MAYATISPATGETVKTFETISDDRVTQVLDQAQTAFLAWREASIDERRKVIAGAAALMRRDADRLAGLAVLEMGKLIGQAKGEVELSASILDYYAEHADRFLAPTRLEEADDASWRPFPIGVLVAVEPWNFPYYQLARVAGPQLMVGNVVVCKHAGSTPQCAQAFADLLHEAGAPAGVWTNAYASTDQVGAMLDDDRVNGVTLTGSERAGSAVAERAGKNLKKAVLELGGSDPLIVLEDAPFDSTLDNIIWGRMNNTGQSCVAAKRAIIVGRERGEKFLKAIGERMAALKAGDPMDPATELGPVSSEGAVKTLVEQIGRAVRHGARVVTGGKRMDRPGFYLEATVLADITPDNPIYREEPPGRPQGPQGPMVAAKGFLGAVPDLRVAVVQRLVVGNRVVSHLRFTGHFTGTFQGTPGAGQSIDFIATDILAVRAGRIADNWHLEDNLTFMKQIGLVK